MSNSIPAAAIVSGSCEVYAGNERLRRSPGGLGRAIAPGGCLVHTERPWHPQPELFARALTRRIAH